MTGYFQNEESIAYKHHSCIEEVIETIANRYIADHPAYPFQLRAYSENGFRQLQDGRYDLDLSGKHPHAKLGQIGYLYAMLWSDAEESVQTTISVKSPTLLYVNGSLIYRSAIHEERNNGVRVSLAIPLSKGWNAFLIRLQKTPTGFGCVFGSASSKWVPLHFMAPFAERAGQGGWIYSALTDEALFPEVHEPEHHGSEESSGMRWYPQRQWDECERSRGVCSRIWGRHGIGAKAYGWTKLQLPEAGTAVLRGHTSGPIQVWVDQALVHRQDEPGDVHIEWRAVRGRRCDIVVEAQAGQDDWGFSLEAEINGRAEAFTVPRPVGGTEACWLYLGPFEVEQEISPAELTDVNKLFDNGGSGVYWRLDSPGYWVRPYLENRLFGRWNYHLGVTLNGLLHASRLLGRADIRQYAAKHIGACVRMYDYSLFDRDQHGYQALNQQLVELDSLDDCGSFGTALLELYWDTQDAGLLPLIEIIADYIHNRQIRREDGAFYRGDDTMWADDLYMSTPFLAGYYKLTGEQAYIDDAAKQFLLFKKYLYMPELSIMSHVYDFKYDTPTYVPWGRGNGWVLFSLSEVLEALPTAHPDREALLAFFSELCAGYLALQGKSGLWHQVLTDAESYEETSCTAMFIYAFARGVRYGWLEPHPYADAACRGWQGLMRASVDHLGNVHGVCRGSNFSFTEQYYKLDLLWVKNDTHGTGIVMLAGDEVRQMMVQ